jgi:hypothetical protein
METLVVMQLALAIAACRSSRGASLIRLLSMRSLSQFALSAGRSHICRIVRTLAARPDLREESAGVGPVLPSATVLGILVRKAPVWSRCFSLLDKFRTRPCIIWMQSNMDQRQFFIAEAGSSLPVQQCSCELPLASSVGFPGIVPAGI